jgi:CBS domain-containing protein
MKIQKLMTTDPRCCRAGDSLSAAARLMWEGDIGSVPVVDEERCVVGMITDRDITMAAYHSDRRLSDLRVQDVMANKVVACRPDDDVDVADRLMRHHQIRRVPITNRNGQLLGVVSLTDLARRAASDRLLTSPQISGPRVIVTLAAISEPRAGLGDTQRSPT